MYKIYKKLTIVNSGVENVSVQLAKSVKKNSDVCSLKCEMKYICWLTVK
jgi:hypothetical protein